MKPVSKLPPTLVAFLLVGYYGLLFKDMLCPVPIKTVFPTFPVLITTGSKIASKLLILPFIFKSNRCNSSHSVIPFG